MSIPHLRAVLEKMKPGPNVREYLLLITLADGADETTRVCFRGLAFLAERIGASTKQVTRLAKALESQGLIRVERRTKAGNRYHLLFEPLRKKVRPVDSGHSGVPNQAAEETSDSRHTDVPKAAPDSGHLEVLNEVAPIGDTSRELRTFHAPIADVQMSQDPVLIRQEDPGGTTAAAPPLPPLDVHTLPEVEAISRRLVCRFSPDAEEDYNRFVAEVDKAIRAQLGGYLSDRSFFQRLCLRLWADRHKLLAQGNPAGVR